MGERQDKSEEITFVNRISLDLSFIPKMTGENANYTLGQESTPWMTYILECYSVFFPYHLGLTVIPIILYYPLIIVICFCYVGNAIYVIYGKIGKFSVDINNKQWDKPRQIVAFISDIGGKVGHGYEISGAENLPEGPAVIVYFHGSIPMDCYLFQQRLYRKTGRQCHLVISNEILKIPGLHTFFYMNGCFNRTIEECVNTLKKGHVLMIAPGGLEEGNAGGHNYKLIWGKRKGFAQVAIDAKVPIVPMFTRNIQEGYWTYAKMWVMEWICKQTRIYLLPQGGMLPVKLRTYIGEPIKYDQNITAEELAEKARIAVEALRDKHQKLPGNILRALGERFEMHPKDE
ncbi:transmembrane protein 68-like isoform X2 [Hemicordylus capensis]|uniref:transmembrane protein 68-like isoform X2 n=1 Tax=Hemicordylus capensis TaxID=884348 RepID=UPI0023027EF1|nr:transmembrane protein 68-like isoform X2 [Hemicordylus capensis]